MRSGLTRRGLIGAGLAASGLLSACTAPVFVVTAGLSVAQTGAAAYVSGVLETAFAVRFDQAVAAVEAAMLHLGFTPLRRSPEKRRLTIISEELGGRNITIEVIRKTPTVSKINIRVGFFGDQSMSRLILSQLQKEFASLGVSDPGEPVSGVPD